jgi:hypothetical protein
LILKRKFENYGLWVSIFSLVGLILVDTIPNFDESKYKIYVQAILTVLISGGVISNPSAGKWFSDKGEKEGAE